MLCHRAQERLVGLFAFLIDALELPDLIVAEQKLVPMLEHSRDGGARKRRQRRWRRCRWRRGVRCAADREERRDQENRSHQLLLGSVTGMAMVCSGGSGATWCGEQNAGSASMAARPPPVPAPPGPPPPWPVPAPPPAPP